MLLVRLTKQILICSTILYVACRNEALKKPIEESDDILVQDLDGDGYEGSEDCDDSDASIHIDAIEICDGIDNNCDGQVDEGVLTTFYLDQDTDGFGADDDTVDACDAPVGYVPNGSDCDDSDALIYPSAAEVCDSVDNDCNGLVDDGLGVDLYVDADNDGFGDDNQPYDGCMEAPGLSFEGGDCDDLDASIYPGAIEYCDGHDNNCDGEVDDSSAVNQSLFYVDQDGDGYGDPNTPIEDCIQPVGSVTNQDDCDDTDASISPETIWSVDLDGDGYGNVQGTCYSVLLEDSFGDGWNGGALEITLDGVLIDSGLLATSYPEQIDGRFFVPNGYEMNLAFCVGDGDLEISYFSGQYENENAYTVMDSFLNEVFQDGPIPSTGVAYQDALTARVFAQSCLMPSNAVVDSTDCNDFNGEVYPGAPEICDLFDNDCNGLIDNGDQAIQYSVDEIYFEDLDGDGYGNPNVSMESCVQPSGYVVDSTDCNDIDASINPDQVWYADADADGFGGTYQTTSCTQPSGYVMSNTDCNDIDAQIYPGATEYCDSIDQDCDGQSQDADSVDAFTWYADTDGDGFGDVGNTVLGCTQPSGSTSDATDCDDTDNLVFPGSHETEVPFDGSDQDCDGFDVCRDINCDAWPDIVTPSYYTNSSAWNNDSYVFYGSENGYSTLDRDAIAGVGTTSAATGDFNGDGYVDLLLTTFTNGSTYLQDSVIYYGTSGGLSTSGTYVMNNYGTLRSCIADLDDDGFDDIVQASQYNGTYTTTSYIYWGSVNGINDGDSTPLESQSPFDCAIEDMNQDGFLDIYLPAYQGTETSYVYWGSSNHMYDSSNRTDLQNVDHIVHANMRDLDLDGYPDILFGSQQGPSGVLYGSSGGYSLSDSDLLSLSSVADLSGEDLNGDGLFDLVVCQSIADNGIDFADMATIYWNSPSGFSSSATTSLEVDGCTEVQFTDANQDGYIDIVLVSHLAGNIFNYTHNTTSYVYYGSASGYSLSNRDSLQSFGSNGATIADLNDDGYPDLVHANYIDDSNNTVVDSFIYWGSSSGYAGNRTTLATIGVWDRAIVVGNID